MTAPPAGASKPAKPFGRVRTPTILQMEAVECGAAALGIILAYFGRWVPLEELRVTCGVTRDGANAKNLLEAAGRYGLEGKGYRKEPEALERVALPFIVFWNFRHFLVVEGFGRDVVYLNDPAAGPRQVTREEFDLAFTGVVLTLQPGPDFVKAGRRPSLIAALRSRLIGSHTALAYVLLAGLMLVIPGLVVPVFSKVFVDDILVSDRTGWLRPLLLGMALTATMRVALTWQQESYLLRLETKMALAASGRFFWHVLRLPVEFFTQRYAGDISSRLASNDRVAHLLSGDLASNAVNAVTAFFFVLVMLSYDVTLTLAGVLFASLNVAALRFVSRKRVDGNRRLLQDQGKMMGAAMNGLQLIETLKSSGAESDLFSRWAGYHAKVVTERQNLDRYTQRLNVLPPLLGTVNVAVILGLGGLRVMDGALTIGMLVAFQSLMTSFMEPINRLVNLGSTLQAVEGDMLRLDDVLRYRADKRFDEAPPLQRKVLEAGKLRGELELRGVTFGYSRMDPPLIKDFSLHLKPGARVALVGGSGSGKSTVAKLVCGLYDVWKGEILFDGVRREEVQPRLLSNSLAHVDQTVYLFEGSVRENVTLWDSTIPLADVVAATADAAVHDEVAARPLGYDSPVSEDGANFSGGQRQRLEIARALSMQPTLIVLDEATSALDPITEKRIDENLRRRGCSCLVIAHRLSTIRDADEIIVLDRGTVVERGTHSQLYEKGGAYARLIGAE